MVKAPSDRELRISRMKQDTYGHLNEIDRCVSLTLKMLHELRMHLVNIRIAEDENQDEENEEEEL